MNAPRSRTRREAPQAEDTEAREIPQIPVENDALQAMLSELAGSTNAKVTVYRAEKNQQLAYVFACSPEAFSLDELRDRYNGGTFRLFISVDGKLRRNMSVTVEPKQGAGSAIEPPTAIAELAATMREGFALQAAAMREIVSKQAPAPSPFAGLDVPATISAISAAIVGLKSVMAPPPQQQSASIDMLLKGIELAKELRSDGGDGGEPGMMSILRDLIKSPMLAQAVMASGGGLARETPRPPAPQPQVQPAIPTQPTRPQPMPQNQAAPQQAMNTQVGGYLDMLCSRAAVNADPVLYADLIADMMSEDQIRELLALQPTPIDFIASIHPGVAQHREWFSTLIAAVSEIVNEGIVGTMGEIVIPSSDATDTPSPIDTGGAA